MKYFLAVTMLLFFSNIVRAETNPDRTYFVEIVGNSPLKKALLGKLTSKPCFKLVDIEAGSTASGCYAFMRKLKDSKLDVPNTYFFRITLKNSKKLNQPRVFSVQGFKYNGKELTRYFNPGSFSIPSEEQRKTGKADFSEAQFIEQATNTIVGLAFK